MSIISRIKKRYRYLRRHSQPREYEESINKFSLEEVEDKEDSLYFLFMDVGEGEAKLSEEICDVWEQRMDEAGLIILNGEYSSPNLSDQFSISGATVGEIFEDKCLECGELKFYSKVDGFYCPMCDK